MRTGTDSGKDIYKMLIDKFADMSKDCISAKWVRDRKTVGIDENNAMLNSIFNKLSDEEIEALSKFATQTYKDGIYDLLREIEWYIDCKGMKITIDNIELPVNCFEGLTHDFIGRCEGWEWNE